MTNGPTSVKGLIFQTHIYRLKELMEKFLEGNISKAERRELLQLHEDCTDMMVHIFKDSNRALFDAELIPAEHAKKINDLLKRIYQNSQNIRDLLDD
ncbi:hypothetical protein HOO54_08455 [Bacillus sp. WMMC1349]|uniref:hypothetical protein n=1 Tax=Bacillus sp. WMMC1349 TaxID=2736254 RepID=UPI0015536730|nr:hypothetical protein [Bacillus sp. WMMC1349]NPC92250.1 hypothetical protein [Bacillus sp. WMMC1349]